MNPSQYLNQRLYGTSQPPPVVEAVRLGDIDFLVEGPQIRRLRADGREILRSVGLVIRDSYWGTLDLREQRSQTRTEARRWWRCVEGIVASGSTEANLYWRVEMDLNESGLSIKALIGARLNFSTCRAGLMLLHPLNGVVGAPVTVTHSDGQQENGVFPKTISPHQPFFDIQRLTHSPTSDLTLDWHFSGEVFEMEDQRNWSDASFKTYSRPLAWPCPYIITAGECIEQTIELRILRNQENGL